jgi:hypothetical protein
VVQLVGVATLNVPLGDTLLTAALTKLMAANAGPAANCQQRNMGMKSFRVMVRKIQ